MADMTNVTVNSGSLTVTYSAPLYRGGATMVLTGFVLDDTAISTEPLVDHSSRLATVNGGSVVNVNANGAGTGTLNAIYDDSPNNAWKVASEVAYSKSGANMQGGTLTVSLEYNGNMRTVQYTGVTWQNVPIFEINPMNPTPVALTFNFFDHSTIGAEI